MLWKFIKSKRIILKLISTRSLYLVTDKALKDTEALEKYALENPYVQKVLQNMPESEQGS
jgi:hypothetical protein